MVPAEGSSSWVRKTLGRREEVEVVSDLAWLVRVRNDEWYGGRAALRMRFLAMMEHRLGQSDLNRRSGSSYVGMPQREEIVGKPPVLQERPAGARCRVRPCCDCKVATQTNILRSRNWTTPIG